MAKPSKLKIDVMKIDKSALYPGKNGAKYLNCVVWPNKDGVGKFGDTHVIKQELSKEARDAGQKEPIIGNLTLVEPDAGRPFAGRPERDHPTVEHERRRKDADSDIDF